MTAYAEKNMPLAVLIDADNASPKIVKGLLDEVAKLGNASVKRIYGDWTMPNMVQWKCALLEHSIHPVQQFRYTSGKNATDCAMIIDAMDLLYTGPFQGFCIVSSDSDFTRLASRIRESGKQVFGFGEQKTPPSFVAACDRFIRTEAFCADVAEKPGGQKKTSKELRADTRLIALFRSAIDAVPKENGWANLGGVGGHMKKEAKDFAAKDYGYKKLSDLADATGLFRIEQRDKSILIMDPRAKKAEPVSGK